MDRDIGAIKDAIESVKKSQWSNKQEVIKQLEGQLDSYDDEIAKGVFHLERDEAIGLIKSSPMGEEMKGRMVESIKKQYDAEFSEEMEATRVRKAAIQKEIAKEPLIILLKSVGRALKQGEISQRDAMRLLDSAVDVKA
jgi:hypothetical protein